MQLPTRPLIAALVAATIAVPAPADAGATIAWTPCPNTNDFACGQLTVPLEPAGGGENGIGVGISGVGSSGVGNSGVGSSGSSGSSGVGSGEVISLAMRRHLAPVGGAREAVIALAGGPGQAALPFAQEFDALLGPILSTRDLIVFDQRGIGRSHPLSCAAFEHLGEREPSPDAVAVCAEEIGAARGFFQTADTVADIEAIRQAGGYEKLVLYGTSYGTKVAERYAQRYPEHVSALVLDSVVPPNGPDPWHRSTFSAIPRVLRGVCAAHACAHITADPARDLARLVEIVQRHPARGRAIDEHGHAHSVRVTAEDLLGVLFGGDFNPFLRAEFPAAVRSALEGDTAALARMVARAEGEGEEEAGERESLSEGFDSPLYFATTCEEQDFPFDRSASPSTRRKQALAFLHKLPSSAFWPFTPEQALSISDIGVCSQWPFATPSPELDEAPMPAVPTLIFSGEDDIRTPTADARQLASQIPGAHLLVVAHTGHSTLSAALGNCPRKALQAFFENAPMKPCDSARALPLMPPMPLAPRRLQLLTPAPGAHGRAGRALHAVLLTLDDFSRQAAVGLISKLGGGKLFLKLLEVRLGGLRGGWGALDEATIRLHRYAYVPGVAVSGTLTATSGTLRISGHARVRGTLRVVAGRLRGVLDGERVSSSERIPQL